MYGLLMKIENYVYLNLLLEPSVHVVGHLKALSVMSTNFLVCFHSASSLHLYHLQSVWKTFLLKISIQVFISPHIHFLNQIFNVNIVSSFFLIVCEYFFNKRINVWSSLVYSQLSDSLSPNLKFFLQRLVLLLNFNLNSVWIRINLLSLLQQLQQLTELVISGNFLIFFHKFMKA